MAPAQRMSIHRACFAPVDPDCLLPQVDLPQFALVAHARKSAAWLLRRERAQLRRLGAVYAHVPAGQKAPPWFMLAMWGLACSPRWEVSAARVAGTVAYRAEWQTPAPRRKPVCGGG